MPEERVKMLTISEAAAQLGVHANTLRGWADRGLVPVVRLPGSNYRRWTQAQVDAIKQQMGLGDRRPQPPAEGE